MAADTRTDDVRFEDVDWDDLGRGVTALPLRTMALWGTLALFAALFLYDYVIVPSGASTFPSLDWDVAELDWMFGLTLVFLFFYVVVPLYRNKRMTMYYWRQFRKNKAAMVSLVYLLVVFGIGTFGPMFLQKPQLNVIEAYQPPVFMSVSSDVPLSCVGETAGSVCHGTMKHPLGTTEQGKDILKIVIFGMRVSMQVGLIASLIIITIGTSVGTVAAYFGGMVDEVLMRYVDIQQTFPGFFLYLLLVYLFGGSLFLMILIFGFVNWGGIARLVRSEALQRREEQYMKAADSAGASEFWVIRKHLVPNVSNTVITATTLIIPGLILAEAALSFLQLGDPSVPSWGQVIASGRGDLDIAWWISTIPGIFLFFTILAFNFLGDALRDALDPRAEH